MIRRITGQVVDTETQTIVLDVAGIGYRVFVTDGTNWPYNTEITLWTHLAVRETALDLYGFHTRDELNIFELLLTLPKIGPKSALQILTQADIALLRQAVAEQDSSYLAKMSGIGKKTAEKIVVELKDKLGEYWSRDDASTAGRSAADPDLPPHRTDLIDALIALGYSPQDARAAAKAVPADITDTSEAIKKALRELQ